MSGERRSEGVRLLTGQGQAGVAVLGVEGARAIHRLGELFSGTLPAAGGIAYGVLRDPADAKGVVDEVLVVAGPIGAASSGVGESAFEVHLHGSPALVAEVKGLLVQTESTDGEPAPPGFEQRALRAVPRCPSVMGARILLDQSEGAMALELGRMRGLSPIARAEAVRELALRGRRLQRLFRETTVALVGPVNAGKSTLFNVLAGRAAASVSDEEGTTRDALMERARLGPWPVRVIDTAGERDLRAAVARGDLRARVESEGQNVARGVAARADWVLRLTPASSSSAPSAPAPSAPAPSGPAEQLILTRCAEFLGPHPDRWPAGGVSALENPEHARAAVQNLFETRLDLPEPSEVYVPGRAVPFDDRSVSALEAAATLGSVGDAGLDDLIAGL